MYNRAWQLAWKTVRPDFPLGLEFLMNTRVNTRWQKIKAPQLRSLHSVHRGRWVIGTSHAMTGDLGWSRGCSVAVSWGDCVLAGDIANNSTDSNVLSKEETGKHYFYF